MMKQNPDPSLSSFRDPSGHIFLKDDKVYRTVNASYKKHVGDSFSSGGSYNHQPYKYPYLELQSLLPFH